VEIDINGKTFSEVTVMFEHRHIPSLKMALWEW